MKTQINKAAHKIAADLFEIHAALAAAQFDLGDKVVTRPLLTTAISDTPYWYDALLVGKARARKHLQEARWIAWRVANRKVPETELGTLATQIMEKTQDVLALLSKHGNAGSDEDRIAARCAVETPWRLSEIAISYFFATEPTCVPPENGASAGHVGTCETPRS